MVELPQTRSLGIIVPLTHGMTIWLVSRLDFGVEMHIHRLAVVVVVSVKSIANVSRLEFACRTRAALTASYLASGTPYLR
jgi:hypothetical protein